jgi:hypothetical protein
MAGSQVRRIMHDKVSSLIHGDPMKERGAVGFAHRYGILLTVEFEHRPVAAPN